MSKDVTNSVSILPQSVSLPRERPTAASLGIHTGKPKFPQYASIGRRKESFQKPDNQWPCEDIIAVDKLVEAGLVYTGVGDSVRCYYCGGGLRNWDQGDDPMVEHAQWYPNCAHVKLIRGREFVEKVASGATKDEICVDAPVIKRDFVPYGPDTDLEQSDAVQAVLQMGYPKKDVEQAAEIFNLRKRLVDYTDTYIKYDGRKLCEILFEMEDTPNLIEKVKKEVEDTLKVVADGAGGYQARQKEPCEDKDVKAMEEENERIKESRSCKICMDQMADIIFLPCGHMVSCGQCAPGLNKCPICTKVINGLVKACMATLKDLPEKHN